jgi:glucose/arabinose dehydrogenase
VNFKPVAAAILTVAACTGGARAQTLLTTTRLVASTGGLVRPVFVTHAPGDFRRIFIVEQRGSGGVATNAAIRVFDLTTNTLLATPFLTISNVTTDSEQGLLGLAFHPNYRQNGFFYVNYTTPGGGAAGHTAVQRFTVQGDPATSNIANPASGLVILTIDQPQTNHNGGWTAFGPDGMLYIGTGDGGNADDVGPGHNATFGNAQYPFTLLGKMLRIDVNNPSGGRNYGIPPGNAFNGTNGLAEIWMYGLRNPWRNSFDRGTGALYVGEVGQNLWEEIDYIAPGAGSGFNLGWRCYEGNHPFNTSNCPAAGTMVFPISEYAHSPSRCSLTGGYVYRGCAIPDLQGTYFFADYCSREIFSFRYSGTGLAPTPANRTSELAPAGSAISNISSFGEDAFGELYICEGAAAGELYKIVPRSLVGPDCNGNNRRDACDILSGASRDADGDGVPDECACRVDFDQNGTVNVSDFLAYLSAYAAGDTNADFTGDGQVNVSDFLAFLSAYAAGC